jgi:hypothetical protein
MSRINLFSVKGGVGESTFAAALIIALVHRGCSPAVAAPNPDEHDDVLAIFGGRFTATSGHPPFMRFDLRDQQVRFDQQQSPNSRHMLSYGYGRADAQAFNVLITKPCYLAARRYVERPFANEDITPDCFVLFNEPGRALGVQDIARVVGAPCIGTVESDPRVSRSIDAGMFDSRPPRALLDVAKLVLDVAGIETPVALTAASSHERWVAS